MPSPFPGMNPYLENAAVWTDFHNRFLAAAADALSDPLAPSYYVKIGEHLYFHEAPDDGRRRIGHADLSVHPTDFDGGGGTATAVLTEPVTVEVPPDVDISRVGYLELFDRATHEVVTAVELLSPSNKYAGPDREQHLGKRRQVLGSRAHLVEIDLLRGGPRLPWAGMPAGTYSVAVSRSHRRPSADYWPIRLRDPIPAIPIPLREGEPEPLLDLQALLHRVYDRAGYRLYIYESEPEPRLSAADAAWAESLIAPAPRPPTDSSTTG